MFAVPTLKDLMARARTEFRANLKGSDAWVWPNNVYVSGKVIAGMTFEAFGFISYISRQKFAVTAPDLDSLLLHGAEFGIPQKPAAPASGFVSVICDASLTIASGAIFRRTDGVQYVASGGGSLIAAGTLSIPVLAVLDGKAGNASAATPVAAVSGVTTTGTATCVVDAGGVSLGADIEDIESYRARILFRKRNPPHGGSAADYVMWASQVAGVSRVFVERVWAGPGTVRVFPMIDGLRTNGIPNSGDLDRVSEYVGALMPAGAKVTFAAPIAHPIDMIISGLLPNTADVQEAVVAELSDMFFRRSRVAGSDTAHPGMPFLASPLTFSRSWISQAIANATGEDRHVLVSPAADIILANAEIAVPGTITFI